LRQVVYLQESIILSFLGKRRVFWVRVVSCCENGFESHCTKNYKNSLWSIYRLVAIKPTDMRLLRIYNTGKNSATLDSYC